MYHVLDGGDSLRRKRHPPQPFFFLRAATSVPLAGVGDGDGFSSCNFGDLQRRWLLAVLDDGDGHKLWNPWTSSAPPLFFSSVQIVRIHGPLQIFSSARKMDTSCGPLEIDLDQPLSTAIKHLIND